MGDHPSLPESANFHDVVDIAPECDTSRLWYSHILLCEWLAFDVGVNVRPTSNDWLQDMFPTDETHVASHVLLPGLWLHGIRLDAHPGDQCTVCSRHCLR